ncbi:MAG: nickel pincer cofactor biosynthesis protein LarB [Clostridiales bacterium]|nr:nickel pincer cofactor biosynthesis protein LarB [Clostridiales bacterium]
MEQNELYEILKGVKNDSLSLDDALLKLKKKPFEDIGFAKTDTHRALRQGVAEVIYGAGKTAQQIALIAETMLKNGQKTILITRLKSDSAEYLKTKFDDLKYDETSKIGLLGIMPSPDVKGTILVATGGTSDIPVAEEAAVTAEVLGNNVKRLYDVGVSGLHRLLSHLDDIMSANVIIAIAGMEGALVSVIAGLADCPVIGVPTSVGYGASFDGLAALLSMLNSCSSGVSVVNIDNGFGAGYNASLINHLSEKNKKDKGE